MDEYAGLREVSETLAEYAERFGDTFPWPWLVDDLEKAEKLARECIEKGEPYPDTYDDGALY